MRTIIICIAGLLFSAGLRAQYKTSVKRIYSTNVKDSFGIYTSVPVNYSGKTKYDVVYYCDANLKSGTGLREQIRANKQLSRQGNYIFIGIGHIGNYHVLRRRDFILPFIDKKDTIPKSSEYGHVKEFYRFLTTELIPGVQKLFTCTGKRTIIGHSLGGLFVFYCLFRNDGTFTNYMALSPALWIDDYKIYQFNRLRDSLAAPAYLYLSAGSKETFNRILNGANSMNEFLKTKSYANLRFEYQVHPGKTHNSQVPESLKYILQKI